MVLLVDALAKLMDRVETMTTAVRHDDPRQEIVFRIRASSEGSSSDLLFSLQEWTALVLFLTREKLRNLYNECYINIVLLRDKNKDVSFNKYHSSRLLKPWLHRLFPNFPHFLPNEDAIESQNAIPAGTEIGKKLVAYCFCSVVT